MKSDTLKALTVLLASWPMAADEDKRGLLQVYLMAVEGTWPEHVSQAVQRFIQGRVVDRNPAFRPTPPELATEARRLMEAAQDHRALMDRPKRLPAPREYQKPFRPYPRLWEALGTDADRLLAGMSFDRLTGLSRTLATVGEAEMREMLARGEPERKRKGPHTFTPAELAASRARLGIDVPAPAEELEDFA